MPGHEFVEPCDPVVGDAAMTVGEPGLRIDAAELCSQVCKTWFQVGVSGPLLFLVRVCFGSKLPVRCRTPALPNLEVNRTKTTEFQTFALGGPELGVLPTC